MEEFSESFVRSSNFINYWSTAKDSYTSLDGMLKDARNTNFRDKSKTQAIINKWDDLIRKTIESFERLETDYKNGSSEKISVLAEDEFLVRERECWYQMECWFNYYASHYFTFVELKWIIEKDLSQFTLEVEALEDELNQMENEVKLVAKNQKMFASSYLSGGIDAMVNSMIGPMIELTDFHVVEVINKLKMYQDKVEKDTQTRTKLGKLAEEYARIPTEISVYVDGYSLILRAVYNNIAASKNLEKMVKERAVRCNEIAKRFEGKDPVRELQEFRDTNPEAFRTEEFLLFKFKDLKKQLDEYAKAQQNVVQDMIVGYERTTRSVRDNTFFGILKSGLLYDSPSEYNNELYYKLEKELDKYNRRVEQNMSRIREEIEDCMDS